MDSPRERFFAGVRAQAPPLIGIVPFGLVTGVASIAAGLTPFETLAMSIACFSGIVQLVSVQLYATGAPLAVILATAAVLSLRLVMYSAGLAPWLGSLSLRWKLAVAYVLTDNAYALAVVDFRHHPERGNKHWFLVGTGAISWVVWQISVAVGVFVGAQVPASLGARLHLRADVPRAAGGRGAGPGIGRRGDRRRRRGARGLAPAVEARSRHRGAGGGRGGDGVPHAGEKMVWAMILGTAAVTFLLRFSFLGTVKPHAIAPPLQAALRFVPAAVFAAIVVPQVLIREEAIHFGPDNPRLIAAIAALGVAWFTRSVTWTLVGGMVALWVVQAWIGR